MEMLSTERPRFAFAPPVPASFSRIKKTILLIQRSPLGSSPVKAALVERGYHVIHAESVEVALRIWAKLSSRVDLFLADITLGRDAGVEQLVQLLQAENPRLRVLYANDLDHLATPNLVQGYPKQLLAIVENCLA